MSVTEVWENYVISFNLYDNPALLHFIKAGSEAQRGKRQSLYLTSETLIFLLVPSPRTHTLCVLL